MATISRTGITAGGTISPTHITNIIDALDGTGIGITVVASGSFTGSLVGNATTATTASYVLQAVSASFATTATTASYVANASSFPFTGSAQITGSMGITGSLNVSAGITASGITATIISTPQFTINSTTGSAGANLLLNLGDIAKTGGTGMFIIPKQVPTSPVEGTMYWDPVGKTLEVWSDDLAAWVTIT